MYFNCYIDNTEQIKDLANSSERSPHGVYLTKADDVLVLEIDAQGGYREYSAVRIGTIGNILGQGTIEDSTVSKLRIIGGQSITKQVLSSVVLLLGATTSIMVLNELFAHDLGFSAFGYLEQPNKQ